VSAARRLGLAALTLAFVAALGLALAHFGADPVRLAAAQETELPGVPVDSVGEDFLSPVPAAPASPAAPGAPARPRGPRTIEGPGGIYKVHGGKNDVVQMGEDIVIERGEHVLGHVFAMGGSVTVRGIVDDDVVAMGGDVILEEGAQVRGDAVSIGGQVRKEGSASILGSSVSVGNMPQGLVGLQVMQFVGQSVDAVGKVFGILFWALIAWVVVSLTRARTQRVVARVEQAPAAAMGWGALGILGIVPGIVAVALAAVLLVVTIIGIPVAVLVLLGYSLAVVLLLFWGAIVGSSVLGHWLVRRLSPRLGSPELLRNTLVGVIALGAIGLVGNLFGAVGMVVPPAGLLGGLLEVLGVLATIGAVCAGVGGILRTRAGQPAPLPHDPGMPV
jgi:hypothetical protein